MRLSEGRSHQYVHLRLNDTSFVLTRAALAPPFTGYRRLPRHHEFQYWTAEEGKTLMKVSTNYNEITTLAELISKDHPAMPCRPRF